MSRLFATALGAFFLTAVAGCDMSPAGPSPTVLTGVWGGDHVSLSTNEAGSRVEFDCAHGTIPGPLTIDGQGSFIATGSFVREHGGPIRQDEAPDVYPAIYAGTVRGTLLQLTVRLTTNEMIGTFTLTRNSPGRVVKCL